MGDEIWMTKIITFGAGEDPSSASADAVAEAFVSGDWVGEFGSLDRMAQRYGLNVRVVLLPEISVDRIDDDLQVWTSVDAERWEAISMRRLKEMVRLHSGGPVRVGRKGLIWGTSAIECHLSHTDAAYPGDADAVVIDAEGNVRYVIEYKKHTLDGNIQDHRADTYYPKPDGRKYQRLWSLVETFRRDGGAAGGLVILYFGTRTRDVCMDVVHGVGAQRLEMSARSAAVDVRGASNERIGRSIWRFLLEA